VQRWEFPLDTNDRAVHLLGICRMGNDPARSVVDRSQRAHDVPNLLLVDGSSLVTGGRGQPTCTIQALAYRSGAEITGWPARARWGGETGKPFGAGQRSTAPHRSPTREE
jgi:choline dehydrogenase-like flavoprotein